MVDLKSHLLVVSIGSYRIHPFKHRPLSVACPREVQSILYISSPMSKRTPPSNTVPTGTEIQNQLQGSFRTLLSNYADIPPRLKLVDSFLLFFILSGVLQFAYRLLVTSYPYNAFIGGYVFLLLPFALHLSCYIDTCDQTSFILD